MNRLVKKILKIPYNLFLRLYDDCTQLYAECSIGDIVLQRGVIQNNQLLLTSRLCDVTNFYRYKDKTFYYQTTISRKSYGYRYDEEKHNKAFCDLINSYKEYGYNPSSRITVDKNLTLMDGNHRIGLNIYEGIIRINIRCVRRQSKFPFGIDWYYKVGLSSLFIQELRTKFFEIQNWLIETGNTFCMYISKDSINKDIKVTDDVYGICNVLRIKKTALGEVICQFSMQNPKYVVINNSVISKRAIEIFQILKTRYGKEIEIVVSRNCIEGKKMFDIHKKDFIE